jgi:SagB-type dehydrogenase family enzyme
MIGGDPSAAWRYHDGTKHSLASLSARRHVLDWPNQPLPYKIYTTLEPIPLPRDFPLSEIRALDAIATSSEPRRMPTRQTEMDLATLGRLCLLSNGITKRLRYSGGEMAFRAAACTGALYHVELYLVCDALPQLGAGVYHYGAHDHSLRRLRSGDFRRVLVEASGRESSVARAPVVLISTSTFWRNAWKYQARAYRHCFWDSGTVLAHLLAVAAAADLPASIVQGYADQPVNELLGLDSEREVAISLVALGRTDRALPAPPPVGPLELPTVPLSRTEVDYPAIRQMHAASTLASGQEAAAWRGEAPFRAEPTNLTGLPSILLQPPGRAEQPAEPIEVVIRRRGSARRFTRTAIEFAQLSTLLERSTGSVPMDCLDPGGGLVNDAHLIVNAVDGLASGSYALAPGRGALEVLRPGTFRNVAQQLDLGQELAGDAAVNVYFLANLDAILARFGARGYRVAQLEAAVAAGRLYLAAYALGLGATGLTFFDDDVTAFFSPHAAGKSVMFLMAVGHRQRRGQQ